MVLMLATTSHIPLHIYVFISVTKPLKSDGIVTAKTVVFHVRGLKKILGSQDIVKTVITLQV